MIVPPPSTSGTTASICSSTSTPCDRPITMPFAPSHRASTIWGPPVPTPCIMGNTTVTTALEPFASPNKKHQNEETPTDRLPPPHRLQLPLKRGENIHL